MTHPVDGAASLAAGAAKIEITPPLDVGLLMSSVEGQWAPFVAVRRPLFARAVVFEGSLAGDPLAANQRAAIVSLDLLALSGKAFGGFQSFKSSIVAAAEHVVTPEELVLVCTHTHTAPESGAMTDLYLTDAFRKWGQSLALAIGQAIAAAAAAMTPCSLSYGASTLPGVGIHRRVKTTSGIMMSHPEPPEEVIISREGAVDDTVNVWWLRNRQNELISALVNATCHPVYEMCNPEISPDYPGELCSRLDAEHPGAVTLFLNGAAGNINPRHVSAGAAAAEQHAQQLFEAVARAAAGAEHEPVPVLSLKRRAFKLPSRLPHGENQGLTAVAHVAGLRLGGAALAFLPGEPFVETGNELKAQSPFELTGIVGFAEETIGYIPTNEAFSEGGYETGFGAWSILASGSEPRLRQEVAALLEDLRVEGSTPQFAPDEPVGDSIEV